MVQIDVKRCGEGEYQQDQSTDRDNIEDQLSRAKWIKAVEDSSREGDNGAVSRSGNFAMALSPWPSEACWRSIIADHTN
jgi:hypothetical protein